MARSTISRYQAALLEYVALTQLTEELRGTARYKLRTEVTARKYIAREFIEKTLCPVEEAPDGT